MRRTIYRIVTSNIALFLSMSIIVTGTGCGHYFEDNVVDDETQVQEYEIPTIDESIDWSSLQTLKEYAVTNEGYYIISHGMSGFYITYYDLKSNTYGRWCSRADCNHTDPSICTSVFAEDMYKRWIQVSGDYLYMMRMGEDGSYLMRRNLDGSNLTEIAKLWSENSIYSDWLNEGNHPHQMHIHSGYVYYLVSEDDINVKMCRTSLDGSTVQEVVYEWSTTRAGITGSIQCDTESIYIYNGISNDLDDAFITRYYPKTGEFKDVYKKVKGQPQGAFAESPNYNMSSFAICEGGKIYFYGDNSMIYMYDMSTDKITEAPYGIALGNVTYDGKYFFKSKEFKQTEILVLNEKGEEILTIDFKDFCSDYTGTLIFSKEYDDSRYIIWNESMLGFFALDRQALEKGQVNIIKIGEWGY